MTIEKRYDSENSYNLAKRNPDYAMGDKGEDPGFLSFRKSNAPIRTVELDEDSFFLAFQEWSPFVEFSLGAYAATHQDVQASIYTRPSVSFDFSRGESHQRTGCHKACFIGVVGNLNILEKISRALVYQKYVPMEVIKQQLKDESKRGQIYCGQRPDSTFETDPSWHIEEGRVWAPYEERVWYTDSRWCFNSQNL